MNALQMTGEPVTEVKRYPDGSRKEFACRLVARAPDMLALRYDHQVTLEADGVIVPAGAYTHGFFWPRRRYLLYANRNADGGLIAYRFDVVRYERVRRDSVRYLDLALDVWVDAGGRSWLEDEAELAAWVARGLVPEAEAAMARRTARYLLRRGFAAARAAEERLDSLLR